MTASAAVQAPPCPVEWCDAPHDVDAPNYLAHSRRATLREGQAWARISWEEATTPAARFLDNGPVIMFGTEPCGRLPLRVGQARELAQIMTHLGQPDAAKLLRRVVALAEGGAA